MLPSAAAWRTARMSFETPETRAETLAFIGRVRPDSVLVQFPGIYPGTEWFDDPARFGFGVDRAPEPPPEPDSDYVCLRELTRDRRRLVEDRVRLENRMGEGTPLAFIQTQWEEQLDLLQRQEKALDAEIEKLRAGGYRFAPEHSEAK